MTYTPKRTYCVLGLMLAGAIALRAQEASSNAITFAKIAGFNGTEGGYPSASLVQATDGNLYGTVFSGGASDDGTVIRMTPSGKVTTLYSFCSQSGCTDGQNPAAPLIQASDGNLYGTTEYGGSTGYGTVFRITLSGGLTTLYSFCIQGGCPDGSHPQAGLVQASDGNLYGAAGSTLFKITLGGAMTTIGSSGGFGVLGSLIQASDGNLYGTNWGGGPQCCGGTIFQLTTSGTVTMLYNFCIPSGCPDGQFPESSLIEAADGNLYGTTTFGGAHGGGTVFKIPVGGGTLTQIYNFCAQSSCSDGEYPFAGLIQATDSNFYGVTSAGGAPSTCEPFSRCGTVFQLTTSGTLTTLHQFCAQASCLDGEFPFAGLTQATNGNIYGTTEFGGTSLACAYSCGTVYTLLTGLGPFVETQPSFGAVGAQINILGSRLSDTTTVSFDGTPAFFKIISSTEIQAIVPAGATTGPVTVTVHSKTLNSNVNFQVVP